MTAQIPSTSFWDRVGASDEDGRRCLDAVQSWYEDWEVQKLEDQGCCSLTLLISSRERSRVRITAERGSANLEGQEDTAQSRIVQIRPAQYVLDMRMARAAKETLPSLAPCIRPLDLDLDLDLQRQFCFYEMQRMPGIPLSRVLRSCQNSSSTLRKKQECLVESFAAMIAQGIKSAAPVGDRYVRADSPMEDSSSMLSRCAGKVGSSIISRLEKLREDLPEEYLRTIASDILASIKALNDYPVVLNHGDLIPSNILVDEDTWEITGLVDWAEAEYLPFGTCSYGLEHLLGYLSTFDNPAFEYYENASQLRQLFWRRLFDLVPWLKSREVEVRLMRKLGILLWYGFAWDDGAIDRVVKDVDDAVEMSCLQTFLVAD